MAADEHQQLHASHDCLYGVFPDLVCGLEGITEEIGFLHFATTERLLISGRRRALSGIETTRTALRSGRKTPTVAALLDTIVEHAVDAVDRFDAHVARAPGSHHRGPR